MVDFYYKPTPFVRLNCGCLIKEDSGELHEECIPHGQAHFMQ